MLLHSPQAVYNVDNEQLIEAQEILKWFEDWRRDLIAKYPQDWKKRFISDETYFDLVVCVKGTIAALQHFFSLFGAEEGGAFTMTKRLSQNGLEAFFGFVRGRSRSSSVSAIQYTSLVNTFRVAKGAEAASTSYNYGDAE